jgi:glycosyltransferase involved in cell wall biosynthesis
VFHPYKPSAEYWAIMRECEISLSPLTESIGNSGKSDAKYLDAARNGMVFLGSPAIYADVVQHGRTGLIVPTLDAWDWTLELVLANDRLRSEIGRNAWSHVRADRMFAGQARQVRDWYWSLWERREELTRKLVEREPRLRAMLLAN